MKFVTFDRVNGYAVAINAATVFAVARRDDHTVTIFSTSQGAMDVHGCVAAVVAALESATAPPIAAAVEVAPADLERAAQVLEIFARYATPEGLGVEVDHIDRALGLSDDDRSCSWETTFRTLFELAAKLRGAKR